jgi:hypothetical protein
MASYLKKINFSVFLVDYCNEFIGHIGENMLKYKPYLPLMNP